MQVRVVLGPTPALVHTFNLLLELEYVTHVIMVALQLDEVSVADQLVGYGRGISIARALPLNHVQQRLALLDHTDRGERINSVEI